MSDQGAMLGEIKTLLRDALRVGDDIVIADDMPLVGGPIDLDSIDILLLVSTIEKKFEMKIPSEAVGRAAFESVASLAAYVEANREILRAPAATTPAPGSPPPSTDYLARLPHGPEFRFVSAVREVEEGQSAMGLWTVKGDEAFLKGHFPGRPIVPGVLLTEALAQIAGIAAARPGETGGVLSAIDVRFMLPVIPPASIELRASVELSDATPARTCEVIASVAGLAVARGRVTIFFGTRS